jgi:hypothetical protein
MPEVTFRYGLSVLVIAVYILNEGKVLQKSIIVLLLLLIDSLLR